MVRTGGPDEEIYNSPQRITLTKSILGISIFQTNSDQRENKQKSFGASDLILRHLKCHPVWPVILFQLISPVPISQLEFTHLQTLAVFFDNQDWDAHNDKSRLFYSRYVLAQFQPFVFCLIGKYFSTQPPVLFSSVLTPVSMFWVALLCGGMKICSGFLYSDNKSESVGHQCPSVDYKLALFISNFEVRPLYRHVQTTAYNSHRAGISTMSTLFGPTTKLKACSCVCLSNHDLESMTVSEYSDFCSVSQRKKRKRKRLAVRIHTYCVVMLQ